MKEAVSISIQVAQEYGQPTAGTLQADRDISKTAEYHWLPSDG